MPPLFARHRFACAPRRFALSDERANRYAGDTRA